MAIRAQRDLERTRTRLQDWLRSHGRDVRVHGVAPAGPQGFANETLVITVTGPAELIVRIAPQVNAAAPDNRLAEQARVLSVLHARTDIPVPAVLGHEPDPGVLDGPFLLMERLPGRPVPDLPSYHRSGWVAELAPAARAALWWQGVDLLARVHWLDVTALGLADVELPGLGETPVSRMLAHYTSRLDFYGCAADPVIARAVEWLGAHLPAQPAPSSLLWGDARLGNILFDGLRATAVLDWEMCSVGPAEIDLAWFCWMDRFLSEGVGAPRLAGLPGPAETVRRVTTALGRPLADLEYYTVLAGLRFALVTARVVHLMDVTGLVPPGTRVPLHANALGLLSRVLDEGMGGRAGPWLESVPRRG